MTTAASLKALIRQAQTALVRKGHSLGSSGPNKDGVDGDAGEVTWKAVLAELKADAPEVTSAPVVPPTGRRIAWGNRVSPDFRESVIWISDQFQWGDEGPSKLMSCMAFETGETFDPGVRNLAGSSGTGLIQFMSFTAKSLGTTVEELAKMSAVRQLGFVYLYFKQFPRIAGPQTSLADLYMAILMPSFIGKPMDAVLFSGGLAYRQNSGLDANNDLKVTKLEAAAKVYAKLEKGMKPGNVWIG